MYNEQDVINGLIAGFVMIEEALREEQHPVVDDIRPVKAVKAEMAELPHLSREDKEAIWSQAGMEGAREEVIGASLRGIYASYAPIHTGSYIGYSPLNLSPMQHIVANLEREWDSRLTSPNRRSAEEFGAAYYFSRLLARESNYPSFQMMTAVINMVANRGLGRILFPRSFLRSLRVLDTMQPDFQWPTDINDHMLVEIIREWNQLLDKLYDRGQLHDLIDALFSEVVDTFSPFGFDQPRYKFTGLETMVSGKNGPLKFGDIGCSTGGSTYSFFHKADSFGLPISEIVTWDLEEKLNHELKIFLEQRGISLRHHQADFSQSPLLHGASEGDFDLLCAYNSLIPHMSPHFVQIAMENALNMLSSDGGVFFIFGSWSHWQNEPGTVPSAQIRRISEDVYRLEFLARVKTG